MKSFLMSITWALLSIHLCMAVNYTAINNGSWNTATNWSPNGVPGANDNVTIPSPRVMTVPGATVNVTNLTIDVGGTLNFNTSSGVLNIRNNGTVTINGQITEGGGGVTNTEINFFDNTNTYALINNGSITIDLLEFDGTSSTLTITGSGTFAPADINFNTSGVSIIANHSGSLTCTSALTVNQPNISITGTGTITVTTAGDLNVEEANLIIGCTVSLTDDLAIIGDNRSLTITSTGVIDAAQQFRIGPNANSTDNFTLEIETGGILNIDNGMEVNTDVNESANDITITNEGTLTIAGPVTYGTGTAHRFTLINTGTATFTGAIDLNQTDDHIITNTGSLTFGGNISDNDSANPAIITNDTNGTLFLTGDIENDVTMNFSATGNTVNYNSTTANQTIENPVNSRYYNLTLSGTSSPNRTKTLSAITDVDGTVSIENNAVFSVSTFNMTVGGNWTNASTSTDPFTQGTATVTFDGNGGTAAQTIANTGDSDGTIFYNVTINNSFATSPQITVNNNVVVGGTLNLTQGNINLNSNLQLGTAVGSPGTLSYNTTNRPYLYGGGAFVRYFANSAISAATHPNLAAFFPMGSSLSNRPFYVYPTAISSGGTVSVIHNNATVTNVLSPTVADTGGPIVLQHQANWVVTSNTINGTYTLYAGGLTGVDGLGTIGSVNDLRLMRSNNVTGTAGTNTTTYTVFNLAQRTGVTQGNLGSTFYIGSVNATNTPLPIELLSFNAKLSDSKVFLTWSTSTETNNDHFTIERTKDGLVFEVVDQVPGAGNSQERHDYELIDSNPFQGKSYYRLSQRDYDGTTKYFPMVGVDVAASAFDFRLYPNPTKGAFDIELEYASDGVEASLSVSDLQGRAIFSLPSLSPDDKVKTIFHIIPPVGLLPGVYVVKLTHGQKQFIRKLVVE